MKIFNTMSRSLEDFAPQDPKHVTFYSCGPTVYDYPHIGNWYAFIRWDVLVRVLAAADYKVDWVMNITDVGHLVSDADEGEDKLEKGARREGKTAWEIAEHYTSYFRNGLRRLNMLEPGHIPKATEHIPQQIELIGKLVDKGVTYRIDDGIYFDTSKSKDYGKLARLDLNALKAGARVDVNPQKRNPTDFALWKFSPKNQKRDMEWDSPWGKGFPGWHIECSAMSMKFLGDTLDIHAGGIDHIPVHHTNEIAQSEAATGKTFANLWVHSNFILVDGKKMAKSAGNFYTLDDMEGKGFDLMAFRLLVLESHYRTEAHFSWEALEAAQNRLKALRATADLVWQTSYIGTVKSQEIEETYDRVLAELENDLNTPGALAVLSRFERLTAGGIATEARQQFRTFIDRLDELLGLKLASKTDVSDTQKRLLGERQAARDKNDFVSADSLRGKLASEGIGVRDTASGQVWYRL